MRKNGVEGMYDSGINQDNAQQMNRELVLRFLRKRGVCSRIELAKLTNLNPATITNIINDFQRIGVVEETGAISEGKGRSAMGLALSASKYSVIGIRLTRRCMLVGAFDISGKKIHSEEYNLVHKTPQAVLDIMKTSVRKAIDKWAGREVVAIGCAVPGPFMRQEGRIAMMTSTVNWQSINIKQELKKEFELPIFMEHDANAGALAYYWNNGEGSELNQSIVYLAVGEGVGGGIIDNGKLLMGKRGIAGEIGHMSIDAHGRYCECGNRGCLETYCSSISFTQEIKRKVQGGDYSIVKEDSTLAEITEAIRKGDRLSVDEYRYACDCLAAGVVNIINILDPDTIVLDDEFVSVNQEILRKSMENIIDQSILHLVNQKIELIIGDGTQETMLQGAAYVAVEGAMRIFARK